MVPLHPATVIEVLDHPSKFEFRPSESVRHDKGSVLDRHGGVEQEGSQPAAAATQPLLEVLTSGPDDEFMRSKADAIRAVVRATAHIATVGQATKAKAQAIAEETTAAAAEAMASAKNAALARQMGEALHNKGDVDFKQTSVSAEVGMAALDLEYRLKEWQGRGIGHPRVDVHLSLRSQKGIAEPEQHLSSQQAGMLFVCGLILVPLIFASWSKARTKRISISVMKA